MRQATLSGEGVAVTANHPPFALSPLSLGRVTVGTTASAERVEPQRGAWLEFYRQMRRAIETDAAVPVGAAAACRVLEVIEAARRSAAEQRRIPLPAD